MATPIELRIELERSYVEMALAACVRKTVKPSDLSAICPLDYVQVQPSRSFYRAMIELDEAGEEISLPSIYQHILAGIEARKQDPKLELWARDFNIHMLTQAVNSIYADNEEAVIFTAQQVAREGRKREAENKLLGLVGQCQLYGNETGDIATACAAVAESLEGTSDTMPDNLADLMARVVSNAENGNMSKPVPTPWPSLNYTLKGGIAPGELAILAARPGMGKTALAGCIAVEVARTGKPVLFISREVKDITIGSRLIAREGRIDLSAFRQFVDRAPNVLEKIRATAETLAPLPLRIVEKSIAPMSPREVRRLAKSVKGIGLIVVDYLQLLCPDVKSNSREREVAEMSRSMKQLALDCDCPVLLLSQLNRSSEEGGRVPRLSDLRESGAIEQDADIVMFLHATQANQKLASMPVQAIVAKGRSSGTGSANLKFLKPYSDFVEDDGTPVNATVYAQAGNDF